ncbi:MAG: MoaD/ThiS family protein [Candidatus Thorarchaeota archaeon]|nr:MoaD/ThiS family protein [Candidatus Thorarchaeota archaeon]
MKIDVKLYATLRIYAPPGNELGEPFPLDLNIGTIQEALKVLKIPAEKAKIIMLNGIQTPDIETHLNDGDLLVIFPPIGGGEP